jgi:hypothetical protein
MAPPRDARSFSEVVQNNLSKKFEISILSDHTRDKVLTLWKRLIEVYNTASRQRDPGFVNIPTVHLLSGIEQGLSGSYVIFPKVRFVNDVYNRGGKDGLIDASNIDVIKAALYMLEQDLHAVGLRIGELPSQEMLPEAKLYFHGRPYNLLGAKTVLNQIPLKLGVDGTVEAALGVFDYSHTIIG